MKNWSRPLLIGVLMLVFWTSACNLSAQAPALPTGTAIPNAQIGPLVVTETSVISVTETSTPVTQVIPITGENVVQMQCQFCVNSSAHAVFIFPDAALFDVETGSPVTCLTAEVVNGKRVLVCNGTQSTSFNLKICSEASNCLLFPVVLEPCPLAGTGTPIATATAITPVFLSPINTLKAPGKNPGASPVPTQTGVFPPGATSTLAPPPVGTSTPIAPSTSTSAPPPPPADTSTSAPPPPPPPADTPVPTAGPTNAPKPTKVPKPTKMPKP